MGFYFLSSYLINLHDVINKTKIIIDIANEKFDVGKLCFIFVLCLW